MKAEMTSAVRSGMFRFTYPKSDKSFILIDLNHTLWQKCVWSNIRVENDSVVTGYKLGERMGTGASYLLQGCILQTVEEFHDLSGPETCDIQHVPFPQQPRGMGT